MHYRAEDCGQTCSHRHRTQLAAESCPDLPFTPTRNVVVCIGGLGDCDELQRRVYDPRLVEPAPKETP